MCDTTCIMCKKDMTSGGFKKHFFSSAHRQDIINAIHSKRKRYELWLENYSKAPNATQYPKLYLTDKEADACYFCPVCKGIRFIRHNKMIECSHKKEMADFIRECLKKEATIPIVEEVETKASSADVEALKKQIARLTTQLKESREMCAEMGDKEDAFYSMVKYFNEKDTSLYDSCMLFLKDNYEGVYSQLLKDLDEEEIIRE